jgi:hypothetical protein
MLELLTSLGPDNLTGALITTVIVVGIAMTLLTLIVVSARERHHRNEIASSVVADMVARGMAAEEIIAVLNAMRLDWSRKSAARRDLQQVNIGR